MSFLWYKNIPNDENFQINFFLSAELKSFSTFYTILVRLYFTNIIQLTNCIQKIYSTFFCSNNLLLIIKKLLEFVSRLFFLNLYLPLH